MNNDKKKVEPSIIRTKTILALSYKENEILAFISADLGSILTFFATKTREVKPSEFNQSYREAILRGGDGV